MTEERKINNEDSLSSDGDSEKQCLYRDLQAHSAELMIKLVMIVRKEEKENDEPTTGTDKIPKLNKNSA